MNKNQLKLNINLHNSCMRGDLNSAIKSLEKGAEFESDNHQAYRYACFKGYSYIIEYFEKQSYLASTLDDKIKNTGFRLACDFEHYELIKYFLITKNIHLDETSLEYINNLETYSTASDDGKKIIKTLILMAFLDKSIPYNTQSPSKIKL